MFELEQIYPQRRHVEVAQAYTDLDLVSAARSETPYIALNMLTSIDGRVRLAGRSGGLSTSVDRQLFHNLRSQFDAVMVGAGTLRAERYGPLVRTDALQRLRERSHVRPVPLAVSVSESLDLGADLPLLSDPDSEVVLFTSSTRTLPAAKATVHIERQTGEVDLAAAVGSLRSKYGVRALLVEGGPRLNAELMAAGLIDELFVTISAKVVAGSDQLTMFADAHLPSPTPLKLLETYVASEELFLRYKVFGHRNVAGP